MHGWAKRNRILLISFISSSILMVVVCVAYVTLGHWVIARAYYGQSIMIFNRIIQGQEAHPLAFYLSLADRYFLYGWGMLFLLILSSFVFPFLKTNTDFEKHSNIPAWVVFGIIVLISISLQIFLGMKNSVPDYDEAVYYDVARNMSRTGLPIRSYGEGTLFFQHPPLVFFLFSIPFFLGIGSLFAVRFVSTLASVLILFTVFLLGCEIGSRFTGLLSVFLLGLNPFFLYYAHSAYLEVPVAMFMMLSLLFFVRAIKEGISKYFVISGLVLGLSLISKYFAIALLVSYCIYFAAKLKKRIFRNPHVYATVVPALGIFSLWPIFALSVNWQVFRATIVQLFSTGKAPWIPHSLVGQIRGFILAASLIFTFIFILALVRQLVLFKRKVMHSDSMTILLIFIIVFWTIILLFPVKDFRYLNPILPAMSIMVAELLVSFGRFVHNKKPNVALWAALPSMFLLVFLPLVGVDASVARGKLRSSIYGERVNIRSESYIKIGQLVSKITKPNDIIAVNKNGPTYGYLSDRSYVCLYLSEHKEIKAILKRSSVIIQDGGWYLPRLGEAEFWMFKRAVKEEFEVVNGDKQNEVRVWVKK